MESQDQEYQVSSLFGAILFVLLFMCLRVVGVGQTGVVTRLGQVNREWQSGVHLKLPWPLESIAKFDTKIQKEQIDAAASTIDLQDVTTTLAVNYNVDPNQVGRLYKEVGTDWKKRILDPAIQEAFKAVSAQYTASDLLTKRTEVKGNVVDKLRARLKERGVQLDDVSIVNFQFSKEFTAAIEQKQVAQQAAEQAKFAAQKAEQEAQSEINRAKGSAEAQRLQQQTLTADLLQKYAIDKWDGKMPQYVGSGSIFNIPLTK